MTGALVSILCCVTPVLVVLAGALGLTAWIARLDYVLIPTGLGRTPDLRGCTPEEAIVSSQDDAPL